MRVAWAEGGAVTVREVPVPEPAEGEVLVRVLRAGICNTDLEILKGYRSFEGILGHEFVGVVEQGPASLAGQRVVSEINIWCGACDMCTRGLTTHCERRQVIGIRDRPGAFAEYIALPERNLHALPESVSTDAACFIEPLAAALEIQGRVLMDADHSVLVVGAGKLGLLVAQTLALTGCTLTVVARGERSREFLTSRGIEAVRAIDDTERFDVAVECTGNEAGVAIALDGLRPRGTLVMKSTYAGSLPLDGSKVVVDELTLVGSRCGPFPEAVELLISNAVDVEGMIDARFPLDEAPAALSRAGEPGVLKVLMDTTPT